MACCDHRQQAEPTEDEAHPSHPFRKKNFFRSEEESTRTFCAVVGPNKMWVRLNRSIDQEGRHQDFPRWIKPCFQQYSVS